jgi:hypothetical protein
MFEIMFFFRGILGIVWDCMGSMGTRDCMGLYGFYGY